MGACGSKSTERPVLVAQARARERPLFAPKTDEEAPTAVGGERVMTLADIASTTDIDDLSAHDLSKFGGDNALVDTLRNSASQYYREIHNVDKVKKSPRDALFNMKKNASLSLDKPPAADNSPEMKYRWKGAVTKMIAVQQFKTGTAEMAAAPYEAVDQSPVPYSPGGLNSSPLSPSAPATDQSSTEKKEKKKDRSSSWGKLRALVSSTSGRGTFPGASNKDVTSPESESVWGKGKKFVGDDIADAIPDPQLSPLSAVSGDSSPGRTRFAEFQRLRSLPDSALFEELAACPGLSLSGSESRDPHAVCVAIVKYRFDGDNGGSGRSGAVGMVAPPPPPPYQSSLSPSPGKSIRWGILPDQDYLPHQGATLLASSSASASTSGSVGGANIDSSRARTGPARGVLSTSARLNLGMAATTPLVASTMAGVRMPRPQDTFYAEDHSSTAATAAGGSSGGGREAAIEREKGWRYSGAVAKDAKNVLSQVKLGKSDLPQYNYNAGNTSNPDYVNGQGSINPGTQTKKSGHWDTAVKAAKAKSAIKAWLGERPPGGGLTQARVAKYASPKTTSSPGGWLSELNEVEKDLRATTKLRVTRAQKEEQLREEQDRAIDTVLSHMTPPMSSPLSLSSLGTRTGTGDGSALLSASSPVSSSSPTPSPSSRELDNVILSTLYPKRVRLKPSLSDSTRGARATVVSPPKVAAPVLAAPAVVAGAARGLWNPKSTLQPITDSPLSKEDRLYDDEEEEPVAAAGSGGRGSVVGGVELGPGPVGLGFTGRRPRNHPLFKRSAAIKQAVEKAAKVSAEVKRVQQRKGIRSDGGAVGMFT